MTTLASGTMIKGIEIEMGGRMWMIPPLNLAALELLGDRLAAFKGGLDAASAALVLDATFYALRRNYPDISRDQVADMIDIANMAGVMTACMNVSGLAAKAAESPLGNGEAASERNLPNGSTGAA